MHSFPGRTLKYHEHSSSRLSIRKIVHNAVPCVNHWLLLAADKAEASSAISVRAAALLRLLLIITMMNIST